MLVTYAKSTRLPQINPVAENLRTIRLTNAPSAYRHKAQDGIRYIVSEQFVLSINYKR